MATRAQMTAVRRLARRLALLLQRRPRPTPEVHETALVLADLMEEVGWPPNPNRVPTGRAPAERWQVYSLDVWTEPEGGWFINDRFRAGVLAVPSERLLLYVTAYRNAYLHGKRKDPIGRPLDQMMSLVNEGASDAAFRRAVRRRYIAPSARIVIESPEWDYVQVNRAADGYPLLVLEPVERDT